MKSAKGRYRTKGLIENQSQPGSRGIVLRNAMGITSLRDMEIVEGELLYRAYAESEHRYSRAHKFVEQDLCWLHRYWLGTIYKWAGQYRSVDLSKGGFRFAAPRFIPSLMANFSRDILGRLTPCKGMSKATLAKSLAEVHVEFILIHPFREGNGRVARLLADLMVRQSGRPFLRYGRMQGSGFQVYISAITAGLDRNYAPMTRLFSAMLAENQKTS